MKPGWRTYRMDELVAHRTERIEVPAESELERYISLEHMDAESVTIRRWTTTDEAESSKFHGHRGDIVMGRRNSQGLLPFARRAARLDQDYVCSAHAIVMTPQLDTGVDPDFLAYFMVSERFWASMEKIGAGSISRHIYWRDLRSQEFDLPPLDEQRRVVEVMRAVDQEIAAAEKVLQAAVTAGASMVAPAAGTPTSLGSALSLITKGTTPTSLGMGFEESGVRFVKTESIVSGRVDPSLCAWISPNTHAALGRSQIQKGDVLLSIAGTVGRVAVATEDLLPANCNQAIAILRPEPSLDARYLAAWLGTREAQEQMSRSKAATTIFNLSMTLIKQLKIALPDLQSQRAFAKRAAIHSEMVARAQAGVASSLTLRTSLLQELIG